MRLSVVEHPLVSHKLGMLRDVSTSSPTFRLLVEELVLLLSYEATKNISLVEVEIMTPLAKARVGRISDPKPILIPVLRAGLGMLEGMAKLLPTAEVGFLGIQRNENTLDPFTYASRLPDSLNGRPVFLIDPMLATGGTLSDSIDYVFDRGATDVTCVCLLASPEGVSNLESHLRRNWPEKNVFLVLGFIDEALNDRGFIVPGLGDAGDRLYGVVR